MNTIEKVFPYYMKDIVIPEIAKEQEIHVFRACRTGVVDKDSFLNSFEENNFQPLSMLDINDPQNYSLSTYYKFKDVKRFAMINSDLQVPYIIAEGITNPRDGICAKTRDWLINEKGKKPRTSHVDWWLYKDARPWENFKEINKDEFDYKHIQ